MQRNKIIHTAQFKEHKNMVQTNISNTLYSCNPTRPFKPNIKCIQEYDVGQHPEITREKHMHASIASAQNQ